MSVLQQELKATLDRETAALPVGIRTLAQRGLREEWDKQDRAAEAARTQTRTLSESELERAKADIEVGCATIARLECDLLVARQHVAEAHNRKMNAMSALDTHKRQLNRASVPPYLIEAARRVLARLEEKLTAWQVEPPPLKPRPFKLKPVPDPRFPSEEEQRLSLAASMQVLNEANRVLTGVERGTIEGPDDLDMWLQDVVADVERNLALDMKDVAEDPADLERMKEMLRMMATGAHPVYQY